MLVPKPQVALMVQQMSFLLCFIHDLNAVFHNWALLTFLLRFVSHAQSELRQALDPGHLQMRLLDLCDVAAQLVILLLSIQTHPLNSVEADFIEFSGRYPIQLILRLLSLLRCRLLAKTQVHRIEARLLHRALRLITFVDGRRCYIAHLTDTLLFVLFGLVDHIAQKLGRLFLSFEFVTLS
jgi:hypothetical protein